MIFTRFDNRTGRILSTLTATRMADALASVRAGTEELLLGAAGDGDTHYVRDGALTERPAGPVVSDVVGRPGEAVPIAHGLAEGAAVFLEGWGGPALLVLEDGAACVTAAAAGSWTVRIVPPWPQREARFRLTVSSDS